MAILRTPVTFNLDPDDYDAVRRAAEADDRSVSSFLRRLVTERIRDARLAPVQERAA
jgi:hypothetical protein